MGGLSPRRARRDSPAREGPGAAGYPADFAFPAPRVPATAMRDLIPLLIAHGALVVFAITLAARAGAPVPAAPLLVVAGGVAAAGQLSLAVCLVASVVAN